MRNVKNLDVCNCLIFKLEVCNLTLYNIVYLIGNIFMAFVIHKYIHIFYSSSKVNDLIEKSAYVVYFISVTIVHCFIKIPIAVLIVNLILLFFISILYDGTLKKALVVSLIIYFSMALIETLFVLLTNNFMLNLMTPLKYQSEFGIIIVRIICYAFVRFLNGFKNVQSDIPLPKSYWLSLFVILFGTILMLYPLFMSYNISRLWAIIGSSCALLINIMTFYLYDKISDLMQEKLNICVQQEQNRFYENQVEIMVDALEKIKMIRHDLKNKLSPIYDLAKEGNNNEIINQISSFMEFYPINKNYVESGNIAVDSILNYKLYEAYKQNIKVSTQIFIPKDLPLPNFDMAAILGNLLDNAKEATLKTNNAWIECKIRFDRGRLFIEITNSYNGQLCKQKEKFLSIKTNKENHGYGIKSIQNTLKRYNGEIEFWNDESKFTAKVMIYV